jgi:transposase
MSKLNAQIVKLKPAAPTTSKNSSQPPLRDFKGNNADSGEKKKCGAQEGHEMKRRERVDKPDQVIEGQMKRCAGGADMSGVRPDKIFRRQVTEVPEIKPVVIETRQPVATCPCCGEVVYGVAP